MPASSKPVQASAVLRSAFLLPAGRVAWQHMSSVQLQHRHPLTVPMPHCSLCRDPLANSFVAPLTEEPADDPRLVVEEFERSAEDDAEYGIDHLLQSEKLHDDQGDQGGAEPEGAP